MVDHHDIVWVIFVPLLLEFCSFSLINCCSLFNGTVCVLIIGVIGGSTSILRICWRFLNVIRPEPSRFMKYWQCFPVSTIFSDLSRHRFLAFWQDTLVPVFNSGRQNCRISPQFLYYALTLFCLVVEIVMTITYTLCINYEEEALHLEPLCLGVIEQTISWYLLIVYCSVVIRPELFQQYQLSLCFQYFL